nr:hypothetical protein [uncultured Rhodoferax sp.]
MQSLDKRIAALEQTKPASIGPIFIHLVGMDTKDSEIVRVTKGDKEWQRQPNESERDLKDRAIREAPPPKQGCSTTFLCY